MGFKLKNNNTRRCTGSTCHGRCGYTRSCRVVPVRRPTTPGGKARYTSKSRHDIEVQRAGWVSKVSESGTRTARLALSEGRSADRARPILPISETCILILTNSVKLMICSSAKKGSNRTRTALDRTESHYHSVKFYPTVWVSTLPGGG